MILTQVIDLRNTSKLIKSKPGMFWCYTHMADLPLEKQSADPRYCQKCYELLTQEANGQKSSGIRRKPWWISKTGSEKTVRAVEQHTHNLSTVKGQKTSMDILALPVPIRPIVHPGPKNMALPLDRIAKLTADGMRSKLIARQLNADGIEVSYKTIQRLLRKVSL